MGTELASRWTSVKWGRMHARISRQAPMHERPVILVHGLVVSSRYMVPTAERLAPLCRVYAIDFPGYGLSDKPREILNMAQLADTLAEWMDAEQVGVSDLVANSFGCQVLAEFALRHPLKIRRLVFQGPTIDPAARTFWRQLGRLAMNSFYESPGLGWITAQDYFAAGPRRVVATIRMAFEDRIEEKLPSVQAPTLVVRGARDPLVPQRWAEEVVRLLPRGALAVLPNAGHTVNYTAPTEFVSAMRSFLEL
jgi:2-hydroxy-6-oxonona-2,4-dienedioate hydrolase